MADDIPAMIVATIILLIGFPLAGFVLSFLLALVGLHLHPLFCLGLIGVTGLIFTSIRQLPGK